MSLYTAKTSGILCQPNNLDMNVHKSTEMVNNYSLNHTSLFPLEKHDSEVSLLASQLLGTLIRYDLKCDLKCKHNKIAQQFMQFLGQLRKSGLLQILLV